MGRRSPQKTKVEISKFLNESRALTRVYLLARASSSSHGEGEEPPPPPAHWGGMVGATEERRGQAKILTIYLDRADPRPTKKQLINLYFY
ncbi:hypothetical protein NIES593_22770 [Hydrococcus rivularis NIES-593]|uniref:Uncharacterized protein n=2 Tax=Cyanophyceae TaxID=3028117 RepID=A0A1U7H735_9CYAN|nr:hypothetical protein [Hydrococcus rivularis]OKH10823.1 hypothetical protein NIES592_23895 [Fischerella major NIES-592]OKH17844.1 hypothetical protein NIES593_22770 [Hydrococcus rivularis NIES-593]